MVTQSSSKKSRSKDVNKGILRLALSDTVELELEYCEPDSKEPRPSHEQRVTVQQLRRIHAQGQIADAFAWLLHVI
jgi:hypothetical protein